MIWGQPKHLEKQNLLGLQQEWPTLQVLTPPKVTLVRLLGPCWLLLVTHFGCPLALLCNHGEGFQRLFCVLLDIWKWHSEAPLSFVSVLSMGPEHVWARKNKVWASKRQSEPSEKWPLLLIFLPFFFLRADGKNLENHTQLFSCSGV